MFRSITRLAKMATEKTALVPVANGSEAMETIATIDVLWRAGVKVTVASVEDCKTVTFNCKARLEADCLIGDVANQNFDVLALPGGMPGAEHLRDNATLIKMLHAQKESGKLYGAICATPAVALKPHGLLPTDATCHPNFAKDLEGCHSLNERVVVHGNCVTSRAPGTAIEFGLELVNQLFGKEKRDQVAAPMLVK